MHLLCGTQRLALNGPIVMGILNVTPDSFSDGGVCYQNDKLSLDIAMQRARKMVQDGAQIIDIGGESTRPGALPVSEQQELNLVIPVVERLVQELGVIVSVDTSTASVIQESANAGAGMINDVRALQREGALASAAATKLPVCLMHMQGDPESMQANPSYSDVVSDVSAFLQTRIDACHAAGVENKNIIVDPGFGFGKTLSHNLALLAQLKKFEKFGCPILVGLSRKSLLGTLINRTVDQRLAGSLALAILAAQNGAAIIRVHDVAETVDALKVISAVKSVNPIID